MATVQLRFDPNPMKDVRPAGVEGYPDLRASSWIPPISKSECLVLGFPWGAWDERELSRESVEPRLFVPFKELSEADRKVAFLDLLLGHALWDKDIWDWAAAPGRTLVWLLPPPPFPAEIVTPWKACLDQARGAFLALLGNRVKVVDGDESAYPEEFLPRMDGWWRLLGPLATTAGFKLSPSPSEPLKDTVAPVPAATGESKALTDLHLLGDLGGSDGEGLALVGSHRDGRMVFLFANLPQDAEGTSRLKEAVLSLHGYLWGQDLPAAGPPDVQITVSLKEVAKTLSDVRFEGQKWTVNALRKRMDRAEGGPFAAFEACRVPGVRGKLYRDRFHAVMRPLLARIAEDWDESTMNLRDIRNARAAQERFLREPR